MRYTFYGADGIALGHYCGIHPELNAPVGAEFVEGLHPLQRTRLVSGIVTPCRPPRPADTDLATWAWSEQAHAWVSEPTLAGVRAAKWAQIKQARAAAEVAPLTVDDRIFDTDADSQRRIAGAVQLATLASAGWAIDWTLADNTVATLTAADVIAVGIALGRRVSEAHAAARILRNLIDTAAAVAEVNAITWPTP